MQQQAKSRVNIIGTKLCEVTPRILNRNDYIHYNTFFVRRRRIDLTFLISVEFERDIMI